MVLRVLKWNSHVSYLNRMVISQTSQQPPCHSKLSYGMGICLEIYTMLYNILILLCLTSILVDVGQCFRYGREMEKVLCSNQCACLCYDDKNHCAETCHNSTVYRFWMTNCDEPYSNCFGTCQVITANNRKISNIFVSHAVYDESSRYPPIPTLHISAIQGDTILLSWDVTTDVFKILYVIQIKRDEDAEWHILKSEIDDYELNVTVPDICLYQFRIMSMNLFGSNGFSAPTSIKSVPLEPIRNITLLGGAIYYNQPTGEFMSIIQWQDISDLDEQVVSHYSWNDMSYVKCPRISQNMQPSFSKVEAKHGRKFILMRISRDAYGCVFTTQVKAKSVCGDVGGWTNFTMDVSDCNKIHNFPCSAVQLDFSPPGNVENVTLHADKGQNPALIRLNWLPPTDKGSTGRIDHYIIRWGKIMMPDPLALFDLQEFVSTPQMTKLPHTILTYAVSVTYTDLISSPYGFQIIPVAPTQNMTESEYGLFPIFQLQSSRKGQVSNHTIHGTILMDGDGVKIVQVPNTLDVEVVWALQHGRRSLNNSEDLLLNHYYAVKYGKLTHQKNGPDIVNGNISLVDAEEAFLTIEFTEPGNYNLQIMGLQNETLPEEDEWLDTKIYNFTVKEIPLDPEYTDDYKIALEIIIPLFAIISIPVFIIFLRWFRAVYRLKKKMEMERRLGDLSTDFNNDYTNFDRHPLTCHYHDRNSSTHPTVVPDVWEIPHSCLKVGRVLGSGAFGQVLKGRVSRSILKHRNVKIPNDTAVNGTHISVAVKMLKDNADIDHKQDFLKEINLMKNIGFHTNIVAMLGCCTLQDPLCLIVEHLPHGDLQTYLTKIREVIETREEQESHYINKDVDILGPVDLLSFARQIAVGMEFLSLKGFVHRDLAARNILVGNNKIVKIGDFGLTRFVCSDQIYINRKGGKFPLKWMSVEAIEELRFSCASDVWSFGIVLFEIVTLGGTPYPAIDPRQLLGYLKNGHRMERPDNCSEELYRVMTSCWERCPNDRPTFTTLKEVIESMLLESCGLEYFTLMIDKTKSYYNVISNEESDLDMVSSVCHDDAVVPNDRFPRATEDTDDTVDTEPTSNCSCVDLDIDNNQLVLSKNESAMAEETVVMVDDLNHNKASPELFNLNTSDDNMESTTEKEKHVDRENGVQETCFIIQDRLENVPDDRGQIEIVVEGTESTETCQTFVQENTLQLSQTKHSQSDTCSEEVMPDPQLNGLGNQTVNGPRENETMEMQHHSCQSCQTLHKSKDNGHHTKRKTICGSPDNNTHDTVHSEVHNIGSNDTVESNPHNSSNADTSGIYNTKETVFVDKTSIVNEFGVENVMSDGCKNTRKRLGFKTTIESFIKDQVDDIEIANESEEDSSPIATRRTSRSFGFKARNSSFHTDDFDYEADNSSLSETSPSNGNKRISFSSSNDEDEVFKFPNYVQTKRYPQEKHPRYKNRLQHRGPHTQAGMRLSDLTDSGISTTSYSELPIS